MATTTSADTVGIQVSRRADAMSHEIWMPEEIIALRAEARTAVETVVAPVATRLDRGDRSAEPEAAMAKAYGTRVAVDTVRDAMQIYGGYGFAREVSETGESVRLEELYRDAKILEIFEGANELQQWVIARNLIGRDVTG